MDNNDRKKNGVIRVFTKYFIFNGKKEGEYILYYYSGQVKVICNYIDNKKEGGYKEYEKNGYLFAMCNFINNNSNDLSNLFS